MPARFRPILLAPLLALAALQAAPAQAAAGTTVPTPPVAAPGEAAVERIHVEDKGSRIDELRVRGQTRRINVQPLQGADYEVLPIDPRHDPSQGHGQGGGSRGAAGQRVWPLLSF